MIDGERCRTYTQSIQVLSTSPVDVSPEENISHFLLYRETGDDKIWRSIAMYAREDHRVFGLESGVSFDFVVLACGSDGQCEISNTVTLNTEMPAY